MTLFTEKETDSKPFELVMAKRNNNGEEVGRLSYTTDSPYKLAGFFERNKWVPPRKKATAEQVKEVNLQSIGEYAFVQRLKSLGLSEEEIKRELGGK